MLLHHSGRYVVPCAMVLCSTDAPEILWSYQQGRKENSKQYSIWADNLSNYTSPTSQSTAEWDNFMDMAFRKGPLKWIEQIKQRHFACMSYTTGCLTMYEMWWNASSLVPSASYSARCDLHSWSGLFNTYRRGCVFCIAFDGMAGQVCCKENSLHWHHIWPSWPQHH